MDQDDWRLEEEPFVSIDATTVKDVYPGKYCPGNNMDVTTPDMIGAGVAQHQCYHKCVTNAPCPFFSSSESPLGQGPVKR